MHPGSLISAVYLYRPAVDFRKSIDGLCALVEQHLQMNPFSDVLYVFINGRRDRIKALYWHRNGFCLWMKRLEAEHFAWPAPEVAGQSAPGAHCLTLQELQWLLEGFDLWAHKPHQSLHYLATT
jgi:transposase